MWNEICSKVFRDLIEEYNKNNIKYIIFRNYENLPQKNDGKDIDIIVGKNYFKLALKLLKEYDTISNLYEHVDEIKGAVHNKLVDGKESAFKSLDLATIYKEVPIDIKLSDVKYDSDYSEDLVKIYKDLEFNSNIKKIGIKKTTNDIKVEIVDDIKNLSIDEDVSLYIDIDNDNYHKANILGMAIYGKNTSLYVDGSVIKDLSFINKGIYTYDVKKLYVLFRYKDYIIDNHIDDVMIGGYLLNYNVKDDIAYLANDMSYDVPFSDKKQELSKEDLARNSLLKAKFIYEIKDVIDKRMKEEDVISLYHDIELPLALILGKMEYNGIRCDASILDKMGEDIQNRVNTITKDIYNLCGCEFNIGSPKQLGEVLFDKLGLPHSKKRKSGNYSTDETTLLKLVDYPVISLILEYRMLTKLHSTYIIGLKNSIMDDGRIHTIYTQTLTRTGRLSSIEPNLQNIPIRNEYGRLIRKSFVSDKSSVLLSSDYSQIELRVFSHLANIDSMKDAFINDMDIHAKTASDVYHVDMNKVTKDMRRCAKAVNFGIIYGISSFGLASDLGISVKEAREFRDNYFKTYPGIRTYMDSEIKKVHECGYVKTIMNRKRIISEINDSNYMIRSRGERMALNTPIQGSAADILKKAMIDIDKEFSLKKLKSKMLLQIHDELVFNVFKEEEEIVRDIVRKKMENVYKLSVPLKVDISVGNDLYEAK